MFRSARALLPIAAVVSLSACGVNTVPTKQEAAKAAWGEVQNQYQRRADLIPNLVATVQGYARQEKDVLVEVTNARARATAINVTADQLTNPQAVQQFGQAQGALSGALGRLLVSVEKYPDLKSNQNFLTLQSQLEGTENRIAIARRDYNGAVQDYNTTIRTFPAMIGAKFIYSAKPLTPFQATAPNADRAPTVKF